MTVTIPWWVPYAIAVTGGLIGYLVALIALWSSLHPSGPRPGQETAQPPRAALPLPRPGYLILEDEPFPTEPISLYSEHAAQLQAHEREIRQMITGHEPWYLP